MMLNMKSFSGMGFGAAPEASNSNRSSQAKRSNKIAPDNSALQGIKETGQKTGWRAVKTSMFVKGGSPNEIKMAPPNFARAFSDIRAEISRKQRFSKRKGDLKSLDPSEVGVLFFGPDSLGDRLWAHCVNHSDDQLRFIYHHQHAPEFPTFAEPAQDNDSAISIIP